MQIDRLLKLIQIYIYIYIYMIMIENYVFVNEN